VVNGIWEIPEGPDFKYPGDASNVFFLTPNTPPRCELDIHKSCCQILESNHTNMFVCKEDSRFKQPHQHIVCKENTSSPLARTPRLDLAQQQQQHLLLPAACVCDSAGAPCSVGAALLLLLLALCSPLSQTCDNCAAVTLRYCNCYDCCYCCAKYCREQRHFHPALLQL
jgi:hypothetical protein